MWTSLTHPILGIFDSSGLKARADLAVIDEDGGNIAKEQRDQLALIHDMIVIRRSW